MPNTLPQIASLDASRPRFHFASRRSPVYAEDGMVAASQPSAVMAGLRMLRAGGSAADAAMAVAAVLAVVEPPSTGLGGDAFALYYDEKMREVLALNGSGHSGKRHTPEAFARAGFSAVPAHHGLAVTVPGACSMWCRLHARLGRLPLEQVFAPAIDLASRGFSVAPVTSRLWASEEALLQASPYAETLLFQGKAPLPTQRMKNPFMAALLTRIAKEGEKAFYEGETARAIVDAVQKNGGVLTEEDLADGGAALGANWVTPVSTLHGGVRVHECPPNGQGIVALMALNALEALDVQHTSAAYTPERLHLMIEALRLSFADAQHYVCDPQSCANPAALSAALLDKAYAAQRITEISRQKVMPLAKHGMPYGAPFASSDTVQFCAVDRDGNACSMVNSVYMTFGSGIVPKGLGFALQNRGHNFVLQNGHANCVAPQKRPYHTIIPCLATKADGSLFGVMGVMGGFMQPQGHTQVLSALLHDNCNAQEALDRLRFCIEPHGGRAVVALEEGIPQSFAESLRAMGHEVQIVSGYERALFGRGQIILQKDDGFFEGGSDGRADGCVMALFE